MRRLSLLALVLAGCGARTELVLHYDLSGINLDDVVRVETLVDVDPSDGRQFFADQPYRQVATGVGVEVRDFNGTGQRELKVTQDLTQGFQFTNTFIFTLLPPSGEKAPPLMLSAQAISDSSMIGTSTAAKGTFAPGAAVTLVITDQRCNGTACASGEKCCSDTCLDTSADVANCGDCGQSCGMSGDSCSGGSCRCAGGAHCDGTKTCCAQLGCIDLTNDGFNCGACGHACNPGESCVAGSCQCGANPACSDGTLCCSDGSCSTTGTCPCGAVDCMAPDVCCDASAGLCADPSSDNQNCGACGTVCSAPLTCSVGKCACGGTVCAAGDTCCGTGCRTLDNDPANCGMCGNACGAGLTCVGGQCLCGGIACAAGNICCGGVCVDPNTSSAHCGTCDVACSTGEDCVDGQCSCNGQKCVGGETCCADGCFDLQSSSVHCGSSCDAPGCPDGYACNLGHCVQTTCVPSCQNGNMCVGTSCTCGGMPECPASQTCCGNTVCADLTSDHDHCKTCNIACTTSQRCVNGACKKVDGIQCSDDSECANGHCSDSVCCNVSCSAACYSCNLPNSRGMCTAVPSGPDPHQLCPSNPPCGNNGQCAGGQCAYYSPGTSCTDSQHLNKCDPDDPNSIGIWFCDGMGGCGQHKQSCEPYRCGAGAVGFSDTCLTGPCSAGHFPTCFQTSNCATDKTCCVADPTTLSCAGSCASVCASPPPSTPPGT